MALQLHKLSELAMRNPDPELIPGLIDQGFVLAIGKPASGKTFFGVHVGVHVAAGAPWRGRKVQQGPVVYCIAEGVSHFAHRVTSYVDELGYDVEKLPFYILPHAINMRSGDDGQVTDEINELFVRVAQIGVDPKLVVFDTLSRYMPGGDENNQKDCSALVRGVEHFQKEFGGTVMLMHHMRKDGSLPRGSTVLTGAADQVIHCVDRKGSLVDKPIRWTTKNTGKRKDRDDVDQWFNYKTRVMSRGNWCRFNPEFDVHENFWVFKTMYDDEGNEINSNTVEETLILEPIDPPSDAEDSPENDISENDRALLELVRSKPDGARVRESMRELSWSNTKFYDAARALENAGLVAWDENKRLRVVNSPNPFDPLG